MPFRRHAIACACLCFCAPVSAQVLAPFCAQFDPGDLSTSPLDKLVLTADQLDLEDDGISDLLGKAKLRFGDREFIADKLQYDDLNKRVLVNAESKFRATGVYIESESANFDLIAESGEFRGNRFTLLDRGARGTADSIFLRRSGQAKLQGVTYTSCAPGSTAWKISASTLKLNRETGLGSANNATIRLGGVPILYLPYLQFPIDNQRRTGFLFPSIGTDSRSGFELRTPIYLNLGPNYDAIFTPRLLSNRGIQLGLSGRYLLISSQGHANLEYLPHDQIQGSARGLSDFFHEGLLNDRLSVVGHYAEVTDRNYFEDLAGRSEFSALTHLERSLRLDYQAPSRYRISALIQDFQPLSTVLAGVDDPYRRLPEIRATAQGIRHSNGLQWTVDSEATYFTRQDSVEGLRGNLTPSIRWQRDTPVYFSRAQADLSMTRYELKNTVGAQSDSPSRALPVISAEVGTRFDRIDNTGGLQTLEPRLIYLYTPYRDQHQLPNFDSGEADFDFPQLFARNRFTGGDRIADANHVTAAVTWRMLDKNSGVPKLSATIGQIYRFNDSKVTLQSGQPIRQGVSDFLADTSYRLSPLWSLTGTVSYSPDIAAITRNAIALRYRNGTTRADIAYRYRSDLLEQVDVSFSTPISSNWRIAGRVKESLQDSRLLDALAGLEYESCCFALRASYRRYLINSRGDFNSGIFMQLELKGLTRIGTGFDELLPGDNRPLGDE